MDEIAKMIGAQPNMWYYFFTDFKLWKSLMFETVVPYTYRVQGPGAWLGARDAVMEARQRTLTGLAWKG